MSVHTNASLVISTNEINNVLTKNMNMEMITKKTDIPRCSRYLSSFIYRMRLNSWKTKFSNIMCLCGNNLSIQHVFFDCQIIKNELKNHGAMIPQNIHSLNEILYDIQESTMFSLSIILKSVVGKLL